jgi:hypothetical protein
MMKSVYTIYFWWCVLGLSVLALGCQGRKEWTRVQEWDDIQSYEWFIEQHPNSKYADKAYLRLEELYWQETLARDKIRQIQPKKVGVRKGSSRRFHNAIRAYNAYLGRFLDSKHTKEALGRLDTLYWEEARLFDRISHYQKFVNEHPRSPFAEEGIKRLQFLNEHAAIFTDPVLEKTVRRGINKNQGKEYGEILKADLKGMQCLDLWLEPQ